LALSKAAVFGACAYFGGFKQLAKQLSSQTLVSIPSSIQVAGGGLLTSTSILHNLSWTVQGVSFSSSFRVLPLKGYDVILGMDWLEHHSLMHIHWQQQWLQFSYGDQIVLLHGVPSESVDSVLL